MEVKVFEKEESASKPVNIFQSNVPIKQTVNIQQFDPNTADIDMLMATGLSKKTGLNLIKYREKGGKFNNVNDLYKIYGIDSFTINKIKPYIIFETNTSTISSLSTKKNISIMDLNSVDSSQLISIRGIGKILSKRIINYRNILGGYYDVKQLKEVYGINDTLFNQVSKYFVTDTKLIKPLNINNCTYQELAGHPYLTNYQAKAIIAYKKLSGPIKEKKELLDNFIIPAETYAKVSPYLVPE